MYFSSGIVLPDSGSGSGRTWFRFEYPSDGLSLTYYVDFMYSDYCANEYMDGAKLILDISKADYVNGNI